MFNRLTDEIRTTETINYEYDANGNRESRDDGVNVVNYNIAHDSNRLTHINGEPSGFDIFSDKLFDDGTYRYSYAPTDRLETVKSQTNEVLAEYTYNYLNQRIKKVNHVTQETRIYHYDFNGLLLEETDETGASQIVYVYHNGIPKAVIHKADSRYNASNEDIVLSIIVDHLGTPRLALDENQAIVWEWQSDAFGTTPANEDPDEDGYLITLNLRFPGQYYDEETGLHYNWHRYYNPDLGRYITSDPIGLAGGMNTYGYALQNPVSYYDPDGRIIPIIALGAVGAITGAVVNSYITILANDGNVTPIQIIASAASGAIAGSVGALAAPIAGTIVGTGAGVTSLAVGSGISGIGGAVGQAVANEIDSCNESSIIKAGLFGAVGFGLFGALAPTPMTSNSLAQLNSFGSNFGSLMTTSLFNSPSPQTAQLVSGIIVSSAIGAAANF